MYEKYIIHCMYFSYYTCRKFTILRYIQFNPQRSHRKQYCTSAAIPATLPANSIVRRAISNCNKLRRGLDESISKRFSIKKSRKRCKSSHVNDYTLQLNRWQLKLIGAWPASLATSKLQRVVAIISNIICYSFLLVTWIICALHLFLEVNTAYLKLGIVGGMCHWFVSNVTLTTFLMKHNDIRNFVEQIETDWRTVTKENHQEVMLKYAKLGRYVATLCTIFMQGGFLAYNVVVALSTEEIQVGNETRTITRVPFPVYSKLLDVAETTTNGIVFFVETFAIFVANSCTTGAYSLSAVLAAHACGQLGVIKVRITEFVDASGGQNKGNVFDKIGMIVEHHLRTLNFIAYIEKLMNRIYFFEFFRCMIALCITGYMFLMDLADHDVTNMASLATCGVALSFNIFIMCYISELLTEQCKEVGDLIYTTNWYNLPHKVILDLVVIIIRSNLVVDITAGKIVHLSIRVFGNAIKTSFAYLNVMRQML
ncbi:uncharacterized protein LOC143429284 [Xylocopa sonorina]|uniref:uncharacterized protein LOC143429284 n=1 Tax=Xylocopa sonorina TaxID=1818115 RepID=UPI00403B04D2